MRNWLKKMGGVILIAVVLIWALEYFPRGNPGTSREEQLKSSYIGQFGRAIEPVIHPLGFDWRMGVSLVAGSAAKEVVVSTMGVLYQTGDDDNVTGLIGKLQAQVHSDGPLQGKPVYTPLVAFAFMIFILIYFPCIAVIAAIRKESGRWKWPAFLAVYTTALAWIAAFLVYQIGSLLR